MTGMTDNLDEAQDMLEVVAATEPAPKTTWNGGSMNRYCPGCIKAVAAHMARTGQE